MVMELEIHELYYTLLQPLHCGNILQQNVLGAMDWALIHKLTTFDDN